MISLKKNITEILVFIGIISLIIYSSDPVFLTDTHRYISGSPLDPPLYSYTLMIMKTIFKSLNSVIILQTLLIGLSIIFFSNTVTSVFHLNKILKIFIVVFLFIPIIKFYDYLLTEPISYAFSIALVTSVLKLTIKPSRLNFFFCSIFTILLLLTRNQFIFLYPIILLLYVGINFMKKSQKVLIFSLISLLFIFLIHNSFIFLNTYIKKNQINTKDISYVSKGPFYFVFYDAIYISKSDDVKLFENEKMQKLFSEINNKMDKSKALRKYYDGRGHFGLSVKKIRSYSDNLLKIVAEEEKISTIYLKKEISIKIIKANLKDYINHIFKKFYDAVWLFVIVPILIFFGSIKNFLKFKNHLSLFIIFLSMFTISNHFIIYIFGRIQPRYFIYTDFIFLICIFIFFYIFQEKKLRR